MPWTNPTTVSAGSVLTASKWNDEVAGNLDAIGGAWTSFTPALRQANTAVSTTTNYSKYLQAGKLVIWTFHITASGGGPSTGNVDLTIPVTAAQTSIVIGIGGVFDASTSTNYAAQCFTTSTTRILFTGDWSGANNWGATPAIQIASSDAFRGMCIYEAA